MEGECGAITADKPSPVGASDDFLGETSSGNGTLSNSSQASLIELPNEGGSSCGELGRVSGDVAGGRAARRARSVGAHYGAAGRGAAQSRLVIRVRILELRVPLCSEFKSNYIHV